MEDVLENNQSALSKILCGNLVPNGGEIDDVIKHLSASIDNIVNELQALDSLNNKQLALYAPFLGRSILELGSTALIARLDPFRLLVLRGRQMQPNYQVDIPHKSSIRWQGDVLAEKVNNLWDDKSLQNPTRALLGDYYSKLIWNSGFNMLLDAVESVHGDEWISELRQKDGDRFCSETRSGFSSLYSELSKGIHHELVIPLCSTFDNESTKELLRQVIFHVSSLGLVLSVINHVINKLDVETAVEAYKDIQKMGVF